ncbi:MAG: 23S rRNA (adenine(2503)-C(2))-methyltransferase RlmN [Deltaproteobacteria bacterium]|nr:23S rRNA (adenine(2503)-C(2))-methyltransferase RlmN [Deltaproteobacteria bacterium]
MKPAKIDLRNMALPELNRWASSLDFEPFRARQIFRWLWRSDVTSFDQMTNLGKELREKLSELSYISHLHPKEIERSQDGTQKFLFALSDGNHIESVLIPEKGHYTLCLSSQAGCAMGCRFCLTGKGGFKRNLKTSEIVNQVLAVQGALLPDEKPSRFSASGGDEASPSAPERDAAPGGLTNLVFMGMGEPLANYENLIKSLQILLADEGCGFSSRRVTVSTCGLVPQMEKLGRDITVNLAISLHAPDNETRGLLMPINRTYPLEVLIEACRRFPLPQRRMITFEYLLISGVNDSPEQARALAKLLRDVRAKINLIPFNAYPGSEFKPPPPERVLAFQQILIKNHYTTMIRQSKGADISAACGQLHAHVVYGSQRGEEVV